MWKRLARPELRRACERALGLDPELLAELEQHSTSEPQVMAWLVLTCCASLLTVGLACSLSMRACGLEAGWSALGGLFAALCTLNLMRLVHASAGLGSGLDEGVLPPLLRPSLVPVLALLGLALPLSQGMTAALLSGGRSPLAAWDQHPVLALALTLLVLLAIGAPALLRAFAPEAAQSYEHEQRQKMERRIASQRDTCAELCDTLLAYELDRLAALLPEPPP
jgi:hypothetical protein